jgi:hypothetical protein
VAEFSSVDINSKAVFMAIAEPPTITGWWIALGSKTIGGKNPWRRSVQFLGRDRQAGSTGRPQPPHHEAMSESEICIHPEGACPGFKTAMTPLVIFTPACEEKFWGRPPGLLPENLTRCSAIFLLTLFGRVERGYGRFIISLFDFLVNHHKY